MKHIVENKIISIAANSENPNFPVSMCLDLHPKRRYRATDAVNNVSILCGVIGGCSDIMIAGTNAVDAQVVVEDPNVMEFMNGYWVSASGTIVAATNSTTATLGSVDNIRAAFVYNTFNDSDLGVKATELGFGQINFVLGQIPSTPPAGLTIRSVTGTLLYTKNFSTDIVAVFMLNCVAYAVMATGELWSYNFITEVETTNSSVASSANAMDIVIPVGRSNSVDDEMPRPAILLGTNDKAILLDGPAGAGTTVTLCDNSGDDINNVAFDDAGNIWMVNETSASLDVFLVANTVANSTTPDYQFDTTTKPALFSDPSSTKRGFCSCGDYVAYGSGVGLTLIGLTKFSLINCDRNTGWMGAGVKRDYLCEALGSTVSIGSSFADYSLTGGTLNVTGTLTLSPMATGSDKQGLSGFSNSNYCTEAYSAALNFGTGDFAISGAIIQGDTPSSEYVLTRAYYTGGAYSGSGYGVFVDSAGKITGIISDDAFATYDTVASTTVIDNSTPYLFRFVRRGSKIEMWINGVKEVETTISAATGSLDNVNATLTIGNLTNPTAPLANGKISNIKIESGAPTAASILEDYESERWMYTANAKCTIQGTSNDIKHCAFDFEKQQLAVATSDGVTVFRNLMVMDGAYTTGAAIPAAPRALSVCNGNMLYGTETAHYRHTAAYYPQVSTEWLNKPLSVTGSVQQRSKSESLWIELSETVNVPVQVTITAQSARWTTFEAGIITAGIAETYGDKEPKYGIEIGRADYGIEEENSNGSYYYKKRDIVRQFSVDALVTHENAFKLLDNFELIGKHPSAWKITGQDSTEWVVFARFVDDGPVTSYDYPSHSNVTFELIEVI